MQLTTNSGTSHKSKQCVYVSWYFQVPVSWQVLFISNLEDIHLSKIMRTGEKIVFQTDQLLLNAACCLKRYQNRFCSNEPLHFDYSPPPPSSVNGLFAICTETSRGRRLTHNCYTISYDASGHTLLWIKKYLSAFPNETNFIRLISINPRLTKNRVIAKDIYFKECEQLVHLGQPWFLYSSWKVVHQQKYL